MDFISVSDALRWNKEGKGILLDVRGREEYERGHLPMAELLPFAAIMEGKTQEVLGEQCQWKKDLPLLLYCETGTTSMMAARKLEEEGIKAYSVAGGLIHYQGYLEKKEQELWTMVLKENVDTVPENQ